LKATGIVRRIDELGRIVIPKEIRRTLRIRESDPLEIFTDRDGGIILKKYSPIGEISEHAQELCASLNQAFALSAVISDKDQIIASAGFGKRELSGLPLSEDMTAAIFRRSRIVKLQADGASIPLLAGSDPGGVCPCLVCIPVISQSDAIGAVMLASQKPDVPIDPSAVRTLEVVASFLGCQMD